MSTALDIIQEVFEGEGMWLKIEQVPLYGGRTLIAGNIWEFSCGDLSWRSAGSTIEDAATGVLSKMLRDEINHPRGIPC